MLVRVEPYSIFSNGPSLIFEAGRVEIQKGDHEPRCFSIQTKSSLKLQPLAKSMSRSLNDFQNLNIDEMPETRSQAKHGQQAAGRPRAGRSRARGGHAMHTTTRSDAPIHGHSGLLYDTHNLSPESAQRATEGLLSEFFVDQLRGYETSQGAYYAFQLKKPVSVRIHDPANGVKVECTCEAYQRLKSACVHIYVSPKLQYLVRTFADC